MTRIAQIAAEFWGVLAEMAPYLLFGFLAAGVLSVFVSPAFIERRLGGAGFWPILQASAFGVPLPLCSCGVIPVAASLRRHGASRGATTAFLISTPQTGVDSIFVTYSLLGGLFAIFRPIAALVSGVLGGMAVSAVTGREGQSEPATDPCRQACCSLEGRRHGRLWRIFEYGFVALPRDIGRALLAGLVVAAVISVIVPEDFYAHHVGTGLLGMLVMMALGVPVYVCATASVPIAAMLVVKAGVTPGAALAFLMTGPATNAATIVTIWRVMGKRTAAIYLASVAVTAMAAGLTMDYLFGVTSIEAAPGMGLMVPSVMEHVSAVVLLAVLAYAVVHPLIHKARAVEATEPDMTKRRFHIKGMTCTHCAAAVRRALLESPGVTAAEVDLDAGRAQVAGDGIDSSMLVAAVAAIGYEASPEEIGAPNDPAETPRPGS